MSLTAWRSVCVLALLSTACGGLAQKDGVDPLPLTPDGTTPGALAVEFLSPAEGAQVTGMVTASGRVVNPEGLTRVEVQIDSGDFLAVPPRESWTYTFDARALSNGMHSLTTRATKDGTSVTAQLRFEVVTNQGSAAASAPTLAITTVTLNSVTFNWTAPTRPHADIGSYRIGWDTLSATAPVKSWSGVYPSPANPYTLTNLAADTVYSIWMEALGPDGAAGARAVLSQKTAAQPVIQPGVGLPAKVVGGYWQNWGLPNVTLGEVPANYNVIYLAFAVGFSTASGSLQWAQYVQSDASFKSDLKRIQGQGRKVILSIGGWFDLPNQSYGYSLGPDNTANRVSQCVASIKALYATYGFDGIDWDLEHLPALYVPGMVEVSRRLKADLGKGFIVTAAPPLYIPSYTDLAVQLGEDIDFVAPQFYDQSSTEAASRAQIIKRTKDLIAAGVPPSRIGIGTRTVGNNGSLTDTPEVITLATINSVWDELAGAYPALRGAFAWSINLDQTVGYPFANQIAAKVKGQ